jgi:long-chain fatty acid transport protein
MQRPRRALLFVVPFAAAAASARPARADGGYFTGGLGARAAGRAGAFTARADDPSAISYNPAGIAEIDGTVVMAGNRFSYNGYDYTRASTLDWGMEQNGTAPMVDFAQVHNSSPWQAAEPLFAMTSKLGLRDWGFGLAAFAAPGTSKEDFPLGGGQRYMMLSREAIFLDYAASVAWKHRDVFGVGVTAEWISVPRLNYSLVIDGTPFAGAANPVSSPLDMLASTSGSDPFTFNAIVGAWYRPRPFLEFALAGQVVPAHVVTKSHLSVTPLDTSMGTVALTRNGVPASDVTVTLPLPLAARVGARYRGMRGALELFDVELDVELETWSRVNQFTVDTNGLSANLDGADVDLGRIAIQKQWRDTVAARLGGDWAVVPGRLALRAGLFYESAVAAPAYANVDFPGGPMLGGSVGASVAFGRSWEIALAYRLRHQTEVTVTEPNARVYQQVPASACMPPYTDANACNPHYLGQPSPAINAGSYEATSHYLSVALLYRIGT